jgi:hypothetical protein
VTYSGNGFVFAVLSIGGSFMVAVRKHVVMGSYQVVDVMSCENEAEARSAAWAMSEPDGYTGV